MAWIEDVAAVFAPDASLTELTDTYTEKNPAADRKRVSRVFEKLRKIINNHVGVIELADDLDIETVTEIFILVNSAGTELDGEIPNYDDFLEGRRKALKIKIWFEAL